LFVDLGDLQARESVSLQNAADELGIQAGGQIDAPDASVL
jgi:hypothetical protein